VLEKEIKEIRGRKRSGGKLPARLILSTKQMGKVFFLNYLVDFMTFDKIKHNS
jgi:hypothetical protein